MNILKYSINIAAVLLLSGCAAWGERTPNEPVDNAFGRPVADTNGSILDYVFDDDKDTESSGFLGINKFLWRATLDTLSFLPLASTDPYGGVIVTDWGVTANAPNERFKVTAYITSNELTADGIKVVVFKQAKDASGTWVEAPVSPKTASDLEDAILVKARQNKISGVEGS